MNGYSVAEASGILGVSEPRVYRAANRPGVAMSRDDGRLRIAPEAVAGLLRRWGWVPPELRNRGLTREALFVLAALSRSPLGLRSARSVSRRAAIAPATAAAVLTSLAGRALVRQRRQRVVEGDVTDIDVWTLNWRSPEWRAIAPGVAEVVLPEASSRAPKRRSVPSRFAHLFWNEDTAQLNVERDGTLIADRILQSADAEAIAWVGHAIPPAKLRRVRQLRRVPPDVAALAGSLAADR